MKRLILLLSAAPCWGQGDLARQPFMCEGIKTRYLFTPPDLLQRKVPSKWIGFCFTDGGVTTGCTELDLPSLDCIHTAGWGQQPFLFEHMPADAPLFTRQQYMCWVDQWTADKTCDKRVYTTQKLARALIKYEHHPSGGLLYVGQRGAHADAGGYARWQTPELSRAGLERDLERKFARGETVERIVAGWGGRGKRVPYADRLLMEMR